MPQDPTNFPRRLLVAVCGLSPQILTETLYALAIAGSPRFIPTEIHLLTTGEGAHRARLTLLHEDTGRFHRLRRDYGLPDIAFDGTHVHIITGREGRPLNDIRTPEENECLADGITARIRACTQDPDAALHVSIAGGRKTMGYYAGYALSLFGRPQDRLSHVLVTPDYEGNPDFFFPTPRSEIIYTRDNRPLDAAQAEVTLAQIPFIRLRDEMPARLLGGQATFAETIDLAHRASQPPELRLRPSARELGANGIVLTLSPSQFAFYLWVVRRGALEGQPITKPGPKTRYAYAAEFLESYEAVTGEWHDRDKTEEALRDGMKPGFFEEKVSRVNAELKNTLGERLAQSFCIVNRGRRGQADYGVSLGPDQIVIE
ncbi:MAG: CRISPR-associated ring nuclease Csm6 [Methylococcus sp.]